MATAPGVGSCARAPNSREYRAGAEAAQARRTGAFDRLHGMTDFDDQEEEFPLGDGTADTNAIVLCPYCGEENEIAIDPGSGNTQEYVEDCQVCCRPWNVRVHYDEGGNAVVDVDVS